MVHGRIGNMALVVVTAGSSRYHEERAQELYLQMYLSIPDTEATTSA